MGATVRGIRQAFGAEEKVFMATLPHSPHLAYITLTNQSIILRGQRGKGIEPQRSLQMKSTIIKDKLASETT